MQLQESFAPLRAAARAAPTPERHVWDRLAAALFIVAAALVVLTFAQYGVTWDEDASNWYGVFALDYYRSGFYDLRALSDADLVNYGAVFDMAAAALNLVSPFGTYETRHLLNGFVGILGLAGVWRLARLAGGPRAGFLAALFLVLTPNYYGQMFNNPKDVPFAAGMTWSLYLMLRLVPELPRARPRSLGLFALAAGLTMGVRVGGLLALCYFGLVLLLWGTWRAVEAKSPRLLCALGLELFLRDFAPVALAAYAIMLVCWPWAQQAPIAHPLAALATFSHQSFPYPTLFAGQYVLPSELPWFYLPVYIAIALPELVLVLLAAAPVLAWRALARTEARIERPRALALFMLGFAVLFPVAYAIAIDAVLFDGMRHFIFVLPAITAIAALVADRALVRIERFPWRKPAYAALGLYGVYHVGVMALLHPDEYVYYNMFVGGVHGARGVFKLDYWANSYAEAVQALEDYLRQEYGPEFMAHDFTVAVCGPPGSAGYYFPSNFIYTPDREAAQFFIAFTKDDCDKAVPGTVIYRVTRLDTLLSLVIDRRAVLARAPRTPASP